MGTHKRLKIPIRLIIMDALGAVLLGVGVAELFADTNLVAASLQFENYAIFMIIFGIAMMLPIVTYMLSGPKKRSVRDIANKGR